jgi:large conductance mechanosensitive channel
MVKGFRELMGRRALSAAAAGLALALATFALVEVVVTGLIGPVIAAFLGESNFASNTFTINSSEFRYGAVIEAAITFAIVAALAYFAVASYWRHPGAREGAVGKTRACPECTSSISAAAKRCPHCTAAVQPEQA